MTVIRTRDDDGHHCSACPSSSNNDGELRSTHNHWNNGNTLSTALEQSDPSAQLPMIRSPAIKMLVVCRALRWKPSQASNTSSTAFEHSKRTNCDCKWSLCIQVKILRHQCTALTLLAPRSTYLGSLLITRSEMKAARQLFESRQAIPQIPSGKPMISTDNISKACQHLTALLKCCQILTPLHASLVHYAGDARHTATVSSENPAPAPRHLGKRSAIDFAININNVFFFEKATCRKSSLVSLGHIF